jgi:hypothetical protein
MLPGRYAITRNHRWLGAVVALLALLNSGCLDFEKQTIMLTFPKDGKAVHALFVYEGLHVRGTQRKDDKPLKDAMKHLGELVQGDVVIIADPIARIPLKRRAAEKLPPEDERIIKLFEKHVSVPPGLFLTSKDGKLAYCQPLTLSEPQEAIAGFNRRISEEVLKELNQQPANGQSPLDKETATLLKKSAENGYTWLRLEAGRLSVTMPGNRDFFTRLRRHAFDPRSIDQFDRNLDVLAKQQGDVKPLLKRMHDDLTQVKAIIDLLVDSPWSVDQRHDQLTLTLGWGNNEPFHLMFPTMRHATLDERDKKLFAHAKTLGATVRDDTTVEAVLTEFQRSGKLLPKEKTP